MKKISCLLLFFALSAISLTSGGNNVISPLLNNCQSLYEEMHLDNIVDFDLFEKAFTGYSKLEVKNKEILTLIDFSKPSTQKRLYVLDMKNKKLLFWSHVSHGKKSGENYATSFSNKMGSNKSSLGFYTTENTYIGKNGYSLILNGLERGINDRAKARAIVVHGADYSDPAVIGASGRLGRSLGCPALPREISREVIDSIKGGSLLFIYANSQQYLSTSRVLRKFQI